MFRSHLGLFLRFASRSLFCLNIVWGIIFTVLIVKVYNEVGTNGQHDCPISESFYCSQDYPALLGSKALAYYTVVGFLNPSDEDPSGSEPCNDDASTYYQTMAAVIIALVWFSTLYASRKGSWWIIVTTLLSIAGIVVSYQLCTGKY